MPPIVCVITESDSVFMRDSLSQFHLPLNDSLPTKRDNGDPSVIVSDF